MFKILLQDVQFYFYLDKIKQSYIIYLITATSKSLCFQHLAVTVKSKSMMSLVTVLVNRFVCCSCVLLSISILQFVLSVHSTSILMVSVS